MKDITDFGYTPSQIEVKEQIIQKLKSNNQKVMLIDEIIQDYSKLYRKYISSRELAVTSEIATRQISILEGDNVPADMKNEILKLQNELAKTKSSNQETMVNLNKNLQKIIELTQNLDKVQQKAQTLEVENKRLLDDNKTKTKRINELESITKDFDGKIKELTQTNAKLTIENRKLNENIGNLIANNRLLTNKIRSMQDDQSSKMNEFNTMLQSAQEKMKAADLYFSQKSEQFQATNKDDMSSFKVDVEDVKVPKSLKLKFKPHNKGITSISFNSFGNNLITSGSDNFIKHWDTSKNSEIGVFSGFTSAVTEACYDHTEQLLFAGSMDKSAKLWSLKNNKLICTFTGHIDYVNCVSSYHSSLRGITGSSDRTIKEWDFQKQKLSRNLHCVSACHCACISLDDSMICSGHLDGSIRIWSSNDKPEKVVDLHDDQILHMELLKNENQFLTISKDYTIKLFDLRKMEAVYTVTDKTLPQYCGSTISVSSDKKYFAVGSHKGYIYVCNMADGTVEDSIFNKTMGSILSVAWKPFQSQLYVGDSTGYLTVWGTKEGK